VLLIAWERLAVSVAPCVERHTVEYVSEKSKLMAFLFSFVPKENLEVVVWSKFSLFLQNDSFVLKRV